MKASVIYHSRHGKTRAYAGEIGKFLDEKGIENRVETIDDYSREYLESADIVLLGCWTNGLFFFAQHPDRIWKDFAGELPEIKGRKTALFATYITVTGSMFRNMEKCLQDKCELPGIYLKSRNKYLSDKDKKQIELLIES